MPIYIQHSTIHAGEETLIEGGHLYSPPHLAPRETGGLRKRVFIEMIVPVSRLHTMEILLNSDEPAILRAVLSPTKQATASWSITSVTLEKRRNRVRIAGDGVWDF